MDTCILISEILQENTLRIEKFKNDSSNNGIPCFICNSVKLECDHKIESTLDFLGNVVRESIKLTLEEAQDNRGLPIDSPITSEDVIALERLFSALHGAARATQLPLLSPIRVVEEWAVAFLGEKLAQGVTVSISQFLVELIKNLLALTSSIRNSYDELVNFERSFAKRVSVTVDQPIINSLRGVGIHEPDATHIASVVAHQTSSSQKAVFVTTDYSSIIAKRDEIKRVVNIVCSDPLYALYHLSS